MNDKRTLYIYVAMVLAFFILLTSCDLLQDMLGFSNPLTSISISPSEPTVEVEKSIQFTATGSFIDGSTKTISGEVTWSSSKPEFASIDANGIARGISPGTTILSATSRTDAGVSAVTSLQIIQGAGITVSPTGGLATSEAGGTGEFTVVLSSQPTANVTIGLSSSDTGEGTVAPTSLTFTGANWSTAQTVTITGVNDALDDGPQSYTIVTAPAASADASYNGVNPADVSVTNTDQFVIVAYDGNGSTGGSVPAGSTAYEVGATVSVMGIGSLEKLQDGISARFLGWNTSADGSETDHAANATFETATADIILYAQWAETVIGGTGPAGGFVFYDAGSVQSWGRYLEAAPVDQSAGHVWIEGGSTQSTLNGNTSTGIGTGQTNSDAIVAQTGHTGSAAKLCLDYSHSGYDDWFLPSKDELDLMYENLKREEIGSFAAAYYWPSSEYSSNFARLQSFSNGGQYANYKSDDCRVRSVRAF